MMNTQEIWLPIQGYEGLYEVSNTGLVRSVDRIVIDKGHPSRRKGKYLSLDPNNKGYCKVWLWKDGQEKRILVHRLVAMAFLPCDEPESMVVNHLDGNPLNNNVSNLEWCTQGENLAHGYRRTGRLGNNSKLDANSVREIREAYAQGKYQRDIAAEYGICDSLVSMIVNRKTWTKVA